LIGGKNDRNVKMKISTPVFMQAERSAMQFVIGSDAWDGKEDMQVSFTRFEGCDATRFSNNEHSLAAAAGDT